MEIDLTPAYETHLPVILEMMAEFNAIDGYPFDVVIGKENLIEFINNDALGKLWVVATYKEVIGYVVLTFGFSFEYRGRDAFIDEFFLKPSFRGKGIGKKVIQFIEKKAADLNIKAIHLEVEKHNEKGKRLYTGQGYTGNDRMLMTKRMIEL